MEKQTFFDNETGLLEYYPRVIETTKNVFERIEENNLWKKEVVKIRGKVFTMDRLTFALGDPGKKYYYTGKWMTAKSWDHSPEIKDIKAQVENILGEKFNYVLCNYYKDGKTSLGYHRDSEKGFKKNGLIASVSLGTSRDFYVRPMKGVSGKEKLDPNLKIDIELHDGDLLVMGGNMQKYYKHSVPKRMKVEGARINLTFRQLE